jgi:hypothetical protein
MHPRNYRDKLIFPDLPPQEFDAAWGELPLRLRLMVYTVIPLIAAYYLFNCSRPALAKRLTVDDHQSKRDAELYASDLEGLRQVIIDRRDDRLVAKLEQLVRDEPAERRRVGIVHGAGHMRSVAWYLTGALGYHVADAEWITVFSLTPA